MRDKSSHHLPGLEEHLGYWLRQVANRASSAFGEGLQSRQISVAEWVALRQLYDHEDIGSGDLAVLSGMTPGAVSKILDKLEAKGLIVRTTRAADKRSQVLSLTLAGRHVLPQLAALADKNDAKFFDCLDAQEQAQLSRLLQKVAQAHRWKDTPII